MGKDSQLLLLLAGVGLMAGGHKLMNSELGKLGAPHALGGVLVWFALQGE